MKTVQYRCDRCGELVPSVSTSERRVVTQVERVIQGHGRVQSGACLDLCLGCYDDLVVWFQAKGRAPKLEAEPQKLGSGR